MTVTEKQLRKLELAQASLALANACMDGVPESGVTASARGDVGGMATRMAATAGRPMVSPDQTAGGRGRRWNGGGLASTPTVIASAGVQHPTGANTFTSDEDLSVAMSDRLDRMKRSHEFGRAPIASVRWSYPEERQLDDRDARSNTRKIDAVCAIGAPRFDRRTGQVKPLAASGGICLPTNVDYSVPTWSTADRPLRDGLPSYEASRGGVMFVTPPDIGTVDLQNVPIGLALTAVGTGAGSATAIWTEATDSDPGGTTKPVWSVACGATVTVLVDAIPTRVKFGNMESRFAPEQVASNTEQAIAAAAREAETNLLVKIADASKQVCPKQFLGASRDILANADLVLAQYRNSHRYDPGASLTAVFPDWAKSLIRSDIARELAHDNAGMVDARAVSDEQIDDWFEIRGINVVWTLDGLPAGTYGTGGQAITQQFFSLATAGAEPQWPGQAADGAFMVVWFLWVEGSIQFLDGGRLDLGVVRDSLLDATNDYETFVETFEGVAMRGNEIYQVQQMVFNNGASAGSVSPATGYAA
jgi:hypothetical protein